MTTEIIERVECFGAAEFMGVRLACLDRFCRDEPLDLFDRAAIGYDGWVEGASYVFTFRYKRGVDGYERCCGVDLKVEYYG